jgi:LysR family transcriptional regulator, glycine cleavage system transcriptional activator
MHGSAMSRRLPPLNALRAFEVAARMMNFTLAAKDLNVSQGAVSRHVAQLEAFLGTKLFHRNHRDVRLTAEGVKYAQSIRVAFDRVDEATRCLLRADRARPLRIKLFTTVAIKWLVPRLGRFHAQHPDIDVQITTTGSRVRFDAEDVDFTIQIQRIAQPGVHYERLFEIELQPVCCGSFLDHMPTPRQPEHLLRHALLHSMQRPNDWRLWFEAAGITPDAINEGLTFGNSALAYQAAIDGSGIAMAHRPLVRDDLSSGRLVAASGICVVTGESYYLAERDPREASPSAAAFRTWVLSQAAECAAKISPDIARDSPRRRVARTQGSRPGCVG